MQKIKDFGYNVWHMSKKTAFIVMGVCAVILVVMVSILVFVL